MKFEVDVPVDLTKIWRCIDYLAEVAASVLAANIALRDRVGGQDARIRALEAAVMELATEQPMRLARIQARRDIDENGRSFVVRRSA